MRSRTYPTSCARTKWERRREERERERGRVVQTRGPQRLGFGPRRVFLPPVWPPPPLIVFCLVHRMLCTAHLTSSSPRSAYLLLLPLRSPSCFSFDLSVARSLALALNQGRREYARDASLAKYRRRVFPMTIPGFRHSSDGRVHSVSQHFETCLIFTECVSIPTVCRANVKRREESFGTKKRLKTERWLAEILRETKQSLFTRR